MPASLGRHNWKESARNVYLVTHLAETQGIGMERDWGYVTKEVNLADYLRRIVGHLDLLIPILLRFPGLALEVGCGTASHSCFLTYFGTQCISTDINPTAMRKARETRCRFKGKNRLVLADAFDLPFPSETFDLCFSTGFMEHFDDVQIARLLKEQLRVAKRIIFSVPSDRYPGGRIGDERNLRPKEWNEILINALAGSDCDFSTRYYYGGRNRPKDLVTRRYPEGPRFVGVSVETKTDQRGRGVAN